MNGSDAFRRELVNAFAGKCPCGRARNQRGKVCCSKCPAGHSIACRRRNSS